jgi:hypothetical protein
MLRENLALNAYVAEVVEAAVGAETGKMSLTTELGGANHLVVDPQDQPVLDVAVTTLDTLTEGLDVAGLKIDVEGAERFALLGASRLLERVPLIQLEWNSTCWTNFGETREPLVQLLRRAGFLLCKATPTGGLVQMEDDAVNYGPDLFAVSTRSEDALAMIDQGSVCA